MVNLLKKNLAKCSVQCGEQMHSYMYGKLLNLIIEGAILKVLLKLAKDVNNIYLVHILNATVSHDYSCFKKVFLFL